MQDDERGEKDSRWLTLDELVEADCSREEFNGFCATYVKELQKTNQKLRQKAATKRYAAGSRRAAVSTSEALLPYMHV